MKRILKIVCPGTRRKHDPRVRDHFRHFVVGLLNFGSFAALWSRHIVNWSRRHLSPIEHLLGPRQRFCMSRGADWFWLKESDPEGPRPRRVRVMSGYGMSNIWCNHGSRECHLQLRHVLGSHRKQSESSKAESCSRLLAEVTIPDPLDPTRGLTRVRNTSQSGS
jgi:hypothetical protein